MGRAPAFLYVIPSSDLAVTILSVLSFFLVHEISAAVTQLNSVTLLLVT
jgi:hypothetical protein